MGPEIRATKVRTLVRYGGRFIASGLFCVLSSPGLHKRRNKRFCENLVRFCSHFTGIPVSILRCKGCLMTVTGNLWKEGQK
jgi:hypothetical protein